MKTVTVKTAELEGAALDYSVALIAKPKNLCFLNSVDGGPRTRGNLPHYSTDWSQGGPLLDNYIAGLNGGADKSGRVVFATIRKSEDSFPFTEKGATNLIAAMRAIVAAELDDTVEIPEELMK